jgi:hypothetical protein
MNALGGGGGVAPAAAPALGGGAAPPLSAPGRGAASVPRASTPFELAADRLLHAPAVDAAGWAAFRSGSGGQLPLGEELAVAVATRALAQGAEGCAVAWCLLLLQDDSYDGDVGAAAAAAGEARSWGLRLSRALLTRARWADPAPAAAPAAGSAREAPVPATAGVHRLSAALAPLLSAFTRHLAACARPDAPRREADRAVAALTRAVDAALALHADASGGAAARVAVPGFDAEPLAAQLWALMPSPEDAAAMQAQAAPPAGDVGAGVAPAQAADASDAAAVECAAVRTANLTVRLLNRLLLPHPAATAALVDAPGALAKLRAWLSGGPAAAAVPLLRAAAVDLLCTLFKRAPGAVLPQLQAAGLGALAAAAAAPTAGGALVPRVNALVAVGALRERAEFSPGAWWADVAPPLRSCAADMLAALAVPDARKDLLSHFHTSPGGPPARARAICVAIASDDAACIVMAASRLLLATAPERLGGAASRGDRAALLAVPGLAQALLRLGSAPDDALLRRLGAALLSHLASAQAAAGTPTLFDSICDAHRSIASMPPTVRLRVVPHERPAEPDAPPRAGEAAEEVLEASRELLSARVPVFGAMFGNTRNTEALAPEVALRGVPVRGVRALLGWAASGGVAVSGMEEALECLAVAERFMVPELVATLTAVAKGCVNEHNVGELLQFADGTGREALCTWAADWAVAGAHAGALVRAGTLAGLPGGAQHTLMLAIAARADASSRPAGAAAPPAVEDAERARLKRRRVDSHAAMLNLLGAPQQPGE